MELKFRAMINGKMRYWGITHSDCDKYSSGSEVMQYTGIKDMDGKEIFFGDIIEFPDKWERYGHEYRIRMLFETDQEKIKKIVEEYEQEKMERREIKNIQDYEWLLSDEIQTYRKVIGNIHENKDLLP